MKAWLQRNYRLVFYFLLLFLGLIQAGLTELQDDEAYYWVYSKFPAWGYYDHPPMIALLIKMGYALFPNELGVRFFPLLLNVFSIALIENLTGKKNPMLFFAIVLSIAVIQLGGFMAVPDAPLIFFTALFFYSYKTFLGKQSFLHIFFLGLSIALLFYSKYHGLLVVFFTLISNPRLFRRYPVWLAGFFALLLFAPHIRWQYQHDWISFKYHLFESNVNTYKISYTIEYIIGQVLLAGPIAGFVLFAAAFALKPKNELEKALRFTMAGIYLFFLISSFRGRVEANWTTPALIPLMVLSYKFLEEHQPWRKGIFRLLPLSLVLVLLCRIIMLENIVPIRSVQERFHAWNNWPGQMKKITRGLPVVFGNSYQLASKYWFYTGQVSFAQSFYKVRKNNFNYWPVEDSVLGKNVFVLDKHRLYDFPDSINTPIGWVGYKFDSCFPSFAKLKLDLEKKSFDLRVGEALSLHWKYIMPEKYERLIHDHVLPADTTGIGVFNNRGWLMELPTSIKLAEVHNNGIDSITIKLPLPKGKYILRFAIHAGKYLPAHSSDNIRVSIK